MINDHNRDRYDRADVVALYASQSNLDASELHLFKKHLKAGSSILDIGVGGGRTARYLSGLASRYVGIDYAAAMVAACKARFPGIDFRHCDATDMRQFADRSFDAVVFSFNGIDMIGTDERRKACLKEIERILKPGGRLIFSSHHARLLIDWPMLAGARGLSIPFRIWESLRSTFMIVSRLVWSGAYRAGEGYIHDPVHGGLTCYVSTPRAIASQLEQVGFELIETVGARFPYVRSDALSPWLYYACQKTAATAG